MRLLSLLLLCLSCSRPVSTVGATSTIYTAGVGPQATLDLTREDLTRSIRVRAARDKVWAALWAAHQTIGMPVAETSDKTWKASYLQKHARSISGKRLSTYFRCGRTSFGERADSYDMTVRVNEELEDAQPNVTDVRVTVVAWARSDAMSGDPIPCESTGALEKLIADELYTQLKP